MAKRSIYDRLLAAKHVLTGQEIAKSVCKATTDELIPPKQKHLGYLVLCTNEQNVSVAELAELLLERAKNSKWVVVFKALISTHHLLVYGNERFLQYLASSNRTFRLANFSDRYSSLGYSMSPFIRRYGKYINERVISYRLYGYDFCKSKQVIEKGMFRSMDVNELLKIVSVLQNLVDALLGFDCSSKDLDNVFAKTAYTLLLRDLIRLFSYYNEAIINVLDKYFDMPKKQCRDALSCYQKFLTRTDWITEFLALGEKAGIGNGDLPNLKRAPNSLFEALSQHLASLEAGNRVMNSSAAVSSSDYRGLKGNEQSGISIVPPVIVRIPTIKNYFQSFHKNNSSIETKNKREKYETEASHPNVTSVNSNPFSIHVSTEKTQLVRNPLTIHKSKDAEVNMFSNNPFLQHSELEMSQLPVQSQANKEKFPESNVIGEYRNPFLNVGSETREDAGIVTCVVNEPKDFVSEQDFLAAFSEGQSTEQDDVDLDGCISSLAHNLYLENCRYSMLKRNFQDSIGEGSTKHWLPQHLPGKCCEGYKPMLGENSSFQNQQPHFPDDGKSCEQSETL